jgi:hypothetical protein
MIQFVAPFAAPTTVVALPNPEFSNTQGLMSSVSVKQALDGTVYAYKKTKEHEKLEWRFLLTPAKAEELKAAIDYYIGEYIRLVDANGVVWKVLLANDAFGFTSLPKDNWVEIQLQFQGVQI